MKPASICPQSISRSVADRDHNLVLHGQCSDRNRDNTRLEINVVLAHSWSGTCDLELGRCFRDFHAWVMPEDKGVVIADLGGIEFVVRSGNSERAFAVTARRAP